MDKKETAVFLKEKNWLLQEKYDGKMTAEAATGVEKLKAGEPVDYLIGFVDFLDCKIDLSFRPLIPRVETEFWVGEAIEKIKSRESQNFKKSKIICLDIFSGSGCVGLAILKNIKNSRVVFSDFDKNAISQIRKNLKINKIGKNRYKIVKSDIFKKIKGKYDYIFANPPYIPELKKKEIKKTALRRGLDYEPKIALFGGSDGLFFIKKFLGEAQKYLKKDGAIFMEFDSRQKLAIGEFIQKFSYKNFKFFRDQYQRWRFLKICA